MNQKQNGHTKELSSIERNISGEKLYIASSVNIIKDCHAKCIEYIQKKPTGMAYIRGEYEKKIKLELLELYRYLLGDMFLKYEDSYEMWYPIYKQWRLTDNDDYLNNNKYINPDISMYVDFIKKGVYVKIKPSVGFHQEETSYRFMKFPKHKRYN